MAKNGNGSAGRMLRANVSDRIVAAGFRLLLRAFDYASNSNTDHWQFALETNELRRAGLTNNEFRWLLVKGYAKQAREITLPDDELRTFRLLGRFTLLPDSCFVLTPEGVRVARQIDPHAARHSSRQGADVGSSRISLIPISEPSKNGRSRHPKPAWDAQRKELSLDGNTVKVFKWPACNQEVILSVFEEEGWPARINDPLPLTVAYDAKRRLHDTIKCLNRSQKNSLIHFRGDGTGQGVIWEFRHDGLTKPLSRHGKGIQRPACTVESE